VKNLVGMGEMSARVLTEVGRHLGRTPGTESRRQPGCGSMSDPQCNNKLTDSVEALFNAVGTRLGKDR